MYNTISYSSMSFFVYIVNINYVCSFCLHDTYIIILYMQTTTIQSWKLIYSSPRTNEEQYINRPSQLLNWLCKGSSCRVYHSWCIGFFFMFAKAGWLLLRAFAFFKESWSVWFSLVESSLPSPAVISLWGDFGIKSWLLFLCIRVASIRFELCISIPMLSKTNTFSIKGLRKKLCFFWISEIFQLEWKEMKRHEGKRK